MGQNNSLRIISTRPLREETKCLASDNGWQLEDHPMVTGRSIADRDILLKVLETIDRQNRYGLHLVFSSIRAVKAVYDGCKVEGLQFPKDVKAIIVGEVTAAESEMLLGTRNIFVSYNSGGLLEMARGKLDNSTPILFVCGEQRLPAIPDGFVRMGFPFTELAVYKTFHTPLYIEGDFNAVWFFSPSTVESFFKVNSMPPGSVAICIGETTSAVLPHYTTAPVILAERPHELAMVAATQQWFNETK